MSRLGITYEEVAEAALSIEQNGDTPTIDKIRSHLGGTGSNTTISKYLNLWRQQIIPSMKNKQDTIPTPDLVQQAVDRVWHEIRAQADSEIELIKDQAQKLIYDAEQKAQTEESKYNELKLKFDQLQQTYLAQSAEKELLQLDIKSIREEHILLQERYKMLEERYMEMQAVTSQHLRDLSHAHKNEVTRLEETCKSQAENHTKLVDNLKDQNEKEMQNHLVTVDNLKVENKNLNESILKLQTQLQEKFTHIKKLESDLKISTVERDDIMRQLTEYDKKWSFFNDKTLISSDVLAKIYDAPKFDHLIDKFNSIFLESIDKKFFEIKENFKFLDFSEFLKEKSKDKRDE